MLTLPSLPDPQHPKSVGLFHFVIPCGWNPAPRQPCGLLLPSFMSLFVCPPIRKASLTTGYKMGFALYFLVLPISSYPVYFFPCNSASVSIFLFLYCPPPPPKYKPHEDGDPLLIVMCSLSVTILGLYLLLNKHLLNA